jgi:hypothetical protein
MRLLALLTALLLGVGNYDGGYALNNRSADLPEAPFHSESISLSDLLSFREEYPNYVIDAPQEMQGKMFVVGNSLIVCDDIGCKKMYRFDLGTRKLVSVREFADSSCKAFAAYDNSIAVLYNDRILFYNEKLDKISETVIPKTSRLFGRVPDDPGSTRVDFGFTDRNHIIYDNNGCWVTDLTAMKDFPVKDELLGSAADYSFLSQYSLNEVTCEGSTPYGVAVLVVTGDGKISKRTFVDVSKLGGSCEAVDAKGVVSYYLPKSLFNAQDGTLYNVQDYVFDYNVMKDDRWYVESDFIVSNKHNIVDLKKRCRYNLDETDYGYLLTNGVDNGICRFGSKSFILFADNGDKKKIAVFD